MQPNQPVNPNTGDLTVTNTPFTAPSEGSSYNLSLTYDSERAANEQSTNSTAWQGFGYGWASNLTPTLQNNFPTTGDVTVNEGNGSTVTFTPYSPGPVPSSTAYSAPSAVVDQNSGNINVAVVGPSNSLYIYYYVFNQASWHAVGFGANSTYSAPAICEDQATGQMEAYALGPSNTIYEYWYDPGTNAWYGPGQVAGINSSYSAPSCVDQNTSGGYQWVAAMGPSNSLYAYWNIGGTWYGPAGVGNANTTYSAPSLSMNQSSGQVNVYVEGPTNSVYQWWNVNGWNGPGQDAPQNSTYSAPSGVFTPSGAQEFFADGPSNSLYRYWYTGSWNQAQLNGANSAYSDPSASVNPSTGNINVLDVGPNNSLYAYWYDVPTNNWYGPAQAGPASTSYSDPAVTVFGQTGNVDAFVLGPGYQLYHFGYNTQTNSWNGDCPSGDGPYTQYTGANSTNSSGQPAYYCAPARTDAQLTNNGPLQTYTFSANGGKTVLQFSYSGVLTWSGNAQEPLAHAVHSDVPPGSNVLSDYCPTTSQFSWITQCTIWTENANPERYITLGLDSNSLIEAAIDPADRIFQFSYTSLHDLNLIVEPPPPGYPGNPFWEFGYCECNSNAPYQHEMTNETNPDNQTTNFFYTPGGNIDHSTDPLNNTTQYQYTVDGCWNATSSPCTGGYTDGNGVFHPDLQTTTVTYPDSETDVDMFTAGLPTSLASGNPNSSSPYYDGNHTWTLAYTYTSNQSPSTTSVQLGTNASSSFLFDSTEKIIQATDISGNATTNLWNDQGSNVLDELCWTSPQGVLIPSGASCSTRFAGSTSYAYDTYGNVTSVTDPVGNTTNYGYNSGIGGLVCWMAPPGVSTSGATCSSPPTGSTFYTYDGFGNVTAVQPNYGTSGETTEEATYNLDGVPTASWPSDAFAMGTNPGPPNNAYETLNSVDGQTELIDSTTAPMNRTTTYTYDATNREIVAQDPTGYTSTQYDTDGRACWTNRSATAPSLPLNGCSNPPSGNTTKTTYLADTSAPATATTANGDVTNYTYADARFPTKATEVADPAGANDQFSFYNPFGSACVSGPVSASSCAFTSGDSYQNVDQLGRVLNSQDQNGNGTTYSYGDATYDTLPTVETSPLGTTQTGYDANGRPTSVTQPDGSVLSTGYDARSRKCWSAPFASFASCASPPTGTGVSTYAYNAAQQLYQMVDNNGNVSAPLQATTTYLYDNQGNLTTETNDNGSTVIYGYDAALDLTCIGYPVHTGAVCNNPNDPPSSTNTIVNRGYNSAGQLSTISDWLGKTTTYGYTTDGTDRVASITYPSGTSESVSYTYDSDGNLKTTSYAGPAVGTATENWTPNTDDMVQNTSQLGSFSSSYTYGPTNNSLATGTTPGYTAGDSFMYNPNGELATDQRPSGSKISYNYNAADELTNSSDSIALVGSTTAKTSGTTATVPLPSGIEPGDQIVVAVGVQSSNSVSTPTGYTLVASPASQEAVFDRTAVGGETSVTLNFSSRKSGPTVAIAVYRGVATISPVDAYSTATASGSSVTMPSVTTTLSGDQLLAISEADGSSSSYTFTAPSSMTSEASTGTSSTQIQLADQSLGAAGATGSRTSTYSTSAPLAGVLLALKPATASYGYNGNGDRTSATTPAGTTNYGYNTYNQMASLGSTSFSYDGTGLRMTAATGSSNLSFAWDLVGGAGTPLVLDDGTNAYIYGPLLFGGTAPVEQINTSTSQPTYLSSVTAGVQLAFNQNGNLLNRASYSPYGTQFDTASSSPTPFGFQGGYTDPSGLVYLVHRYYDPSTGQLMSVDPMGPLTGQPYEYAGDNPINASDPTGLDCRNTDTCPSWTSYGATEGSNPTPSPASYGTAAPTGSCGCGLAPNSSPVPASTASVAVGQSAMNPRQQQAFATYQCALIGACTSGFDFIGGCASFVGMICVDRSSSGDWFLTLGVTYGAGLNLHGGQIVHKGQLTECQIDRFLSGPTLSTGMSAFFGVEALWGRIGSNGNASTGVEESVGPQAGGAVSASLTFGPTC